jgi:hypothetical protein
MVVQIRLSRLANCEFIKRKENIILSSSTGIGKSFVVLTIFHQACVLGFCAPYQHST